MAGGEYETARVWGDNEGGDAWDFFLWPQIMQTIHLPIHNLIEWVTPSLIWLQLLCSL